MKSVLQFFASYNAITQSTFEKLAMYNAKYYTLNALFHRTTLYYTLREHDVFC